MNRIYLLLLLPVIAAVLGACSGGGGIERESAKKPAECRIVSDVEQAGSPCVVRCQITGDPDFDLLRFTWTWNVHGGTVKEKSADGTVAWISIDEPGVCQIYARGVDRDGKDCTTPKHLIKSHKKYNAAPIVIDFGGPTFVEEGTEAGDDGTVWTYHEWTWQGRAYDPEDRAKGIEISSWSWGIFDGGDLDGDGIPDTQIGGHTDDGEGFSREPTKIKVMIRESPSKLTVRVYQYEVDDRDVRIALTVTDSAAKSRKWGDGHVTLMK